MCREYFQLKSCGHFALILQVRCNKTTPCDNSDWVTNFWKGEAGDPQYGAGVCEKCSSLLTQGGNAAAMTEAGMKCESNTVKLTVQFQQAGSRIEFTVPKYMPFFEVERMIWGQLGVDGARRVEIDWRYHPGGKSALPIENQGDWEKYVRICGVEMLLLIEREDGQQQA